MKCNKRYFQKCAALALSFSFLIPCFNADFCAGGEINGMIIGRDKESREVWVDIGTGGGVKEKDFLSVYSGGEKTAVLRVRKVFDSFSIAKTIYDSDFDKVREMDKVKFDLSARRDEAGEPAVDGAKVSAVDVPLSEDEATLHDKIELSYDSDVLSKESKSLKSDVENLRKQLDDRTKSLNAAERKIDSLQSQLRKKEELKAKITAMMNEAISQLDELRVKSAAK